MMNASEDGPCVACLGPFSTALIVVSLCFVLRALLSSANAPGKAAAAGTSFDDFVKDKSIRSAPSSHTSSKAKPSTSFEAFLKTGSGGKPAGKPNVRGTSFDAYVRSGDAAGVASQVEGTSKKGNARKESEGTHEDKARATILLLYGTEYGFSRELAEKMQEKLLASDYRPLLLDMKEADLHRDVLTKQCALVFVSTQGDGVPPPDARDFYDQLHDCSLSPSLLSSLRFSVLALGDSNYTHFCKCGRDFDLQLERLGANRFFTRADVDQEDWDVINSWMGEIVEKLPTLKLEKAKQSQNPLPGHFVANTAADGKGSRKDRNMYGKNRPYKAPIVAKYNLCMGEDALRDKVTFHIEFSLSPDSSGETPDAGPSGLEYLPGDALGVYPSNDEEEVCQVLHALGRTGEEMVPSPKWFITPFAEDEERPSETSLKAALSSCYELQNLKPSLLSFLADWLVQMGLADSEICRLIKSGGLSIKTNEGLAKYLRSHRLGEVLSEVRESVSLETFPYQSMLQHLRQLQPRLYSISSSPLSHPARVSITVAVLQYEEKEQGPLPILRRGVCSNYLAARTLGEHCLVYVHRNPDFRLPTSLDTPIIMVGPGTGLAPFRAFIQHRTILQAAVGGLQKPNEGKKDMGLYQILFFGCRNKERDYLYREELERWEREKLIALQTAFSRDQGPKVYVQDKIRQPEIQSKLWALLEAGAAFYVCGDALHMAGDVELALLELIGKQSGNSDLEYAKDYLRKMAEGQRYQRDVWF